MVELPGWTRSARLPTIQIVMSPCATSGAGQLWSPEARNRGIGFVWRRDASLRVAWRTSKTYERSRPEGRGPRGSYADWPSAGERLVARRCGANTDGWGLATADGRGACPHPAKFVGAKPHRPSLLIAGAVEGMLFQRSEEDLIRSARGGDRAAFAELLRPEYRAAYRLAYGLLQDVDEAEDAVQDAAFAAWRKIGNLREGSSLRPWFLGIVVNRCRNVRRSRWWLVERSEPPERIAPNVDLAAAIDLRRALRRLGHDERLVLVLRYYLDMPFEEIGSSLGISPKAARTRVERAVHRLKPILQVQGAAV